MKMKFVSVIIAAALASAILAGCGGSSAVSLKDGTYEGKSEIHENEGEDGSDEGNGYGVVNITVEDGIISECEYKTYEPDGTLKDENYGMKQGSVANKDYFNKAQKAVAACDEYASMLVANGSLDGIDAISGATINYEEFQEAVNDALSKAQE